MCGTGPLAVWHIHTSGVGCSPKAGSIFGRTLLADMANHSFDPNVEVKPTDAGIGLFAKRQVGSP